MIRPPAVAGRFYTADARELARQIREFCSDGHEKVNALGCVVPHAGYMFSGHVAGAVYASLQIPARCILLGPRHFPGGEAMAILSEGTWQTPFGEARIDSALAKELMRGVPHLREDFVAHEREHSLEVQLPFLQQLARDTQKDIQFVPVVIGLDRYSELETLGNAVAQVVAAQSEPVLIIASSDMNHYENDDVTRDKDRHAIDRILALDPRGLYDTVRAEGITMCGYAATVAMLIAMKKLNATEAKLVRYATSGDINGDRDEVVGYAGIVIR